MAPAAEHRPSGSVSQTQNHKAQLATAYNELGKELSSQKIKVVGNYTLGKVIGEGPYDAPRLLVCVSLGGMQEHTGRSGWESTV